MKKVSKSAEIAMSVRRFVNAKTGTVAFKSKKAYNRKDKKWKNDF